MSEFAIDVDLKNPNYESIDGVLIDKVNNTLVQFPAGKNGAYTIPSFIKTIRTCAFQGCDKLESVSIPDNVTSIKDNAFQHCKNLKQ